MGEIIYCNEPSFPKPPIPGSIKNKVIQTKRFGATVWENTFTDQLRKRECLCFSCDKIKECNQAKQLYNICKTNDMALMITRCKNFKIK